MLVITLGEITGDQAWVSQPELLLAVMIVTAVFVFADVLAGKLENGLWAGYLNFVALIIWVAIAVFPALIVIAVGCTVTALLRLVIGGRWQYDHVPRSQIVFTAIGRFTIVAWGMLTAETVLRWIGASTPYVAINLLEALQLGVAMICGLMMTQIIGMLYVPITPEIRARLFWSVGQRRRIFQELLLLMVAPAMGVFLLNSGLFPFSLMMWVVTIQAFRYFEVYRTQQSLIKRIEHLSTLDTIGKDIASNLDIDEVLIAIHQRISRIVDVSLYYVVLYDPHLNLLEFPLAIEDGVRKDPTVSSPETSPMTYFVAGRGLMLHITMENRAEYAAQGLKMPNDYMSFLGVPLMAREKLLGAVCLGSRNKPNFTSDEISLVQNVTNQAGLTIRNAVLYNRSLEMSKNLARINQFIQNVVFNTDVLTTIKAASEVAMQISQADRMAVFYLNEDNRQQLSLTHTINILPEHEAQLSANGQATQVVTELIKTVTNVMMVEDAELQDDGRIGEYRSKLELALRSGNATVGVMVLYFKNPHYYRSSEIDLLEALSYQITAALDNAELLRALEVYASEQAQLVHLSRISTSSLELEQVIGGVLDLMRHMMEVDHAYIGLYEEDEQIIRLYGVSYRLNIRQVPELSQLDVMPQFYGREDVSRDLGRFMIDTDNESLVIAPMVVENKRIGVVMLGTPHRFGESQIRLLELTTNQISVQIHNALQYRFVQEALQKRLHQLAFIEDIARQISSALNVEQLIGNVLDAAIRATQADMAALALVNNDGDFQIIGQENIDGRVQTQQVKRASHSGVMGRVAKTRQVILIPDNRQVKDYLATFTQGMYLSSLVVPLMKDDQVIGVLDLESSQLDFFTHEHADFLQSLAGHAVISIQNARLLQERQRQIETLTHLRHLSLKLSSNTDRRTVINAVLQATLTVLNSEYAVIYGYPEDSEELTLFGGMRRTESGFINAFPFLPDVIPITTAEKGEIYVIHNTRGHESFKEIPDSSLDYTSIIAAPIKHGGRVREVLCVAFARPRADLTYEVNTLELLTIQSAGHLENTLLYERVLSSTQRLKVFLDSSSDGIIFLDEQGNLVQANATAETILKLDLSDAVGENFVMVLLRRIEENQDTMDASEGLRNMARILRLEPEKIIRRQFELRHRGQLTHIEEVSSPVWDNHNRMMGRLIILRDITEEKLLEAYREEITQMVIHDLRGPLTAIFSGLSFSKDILLDPQDLSIEDMLLPALDVAINSTSGLLTLVDSLLDISKLENRSLPLNRSSVNLNDLVNKVLEATGRLLEDAELKVVLELPETLPNVLIDEDKIQRVIQNLVDNAIRYSPQGGTILIEGRVIDHAKRVLMRVADSGRGIPSDERDRVFEKFRQVANNKPNRGRKGTGIGLTFCKLVLEAHGERIWVEAEPPMSGASFAFTLPVVH